MRRSLLALLLLAILVLPATSSDQDYEIGSGDVLHVIVLDQAGLTGDFKVDPEGLLNFPFLGKVKVSGMATLEVERKLTTLLSEGYLRKPRVAVTLKEFGSQLVYVTGEFKTPGPYSLKADRSLLALLTQVGEMTANAGHEVIVIRPPALDLAPPPAEDAAAPSPPVARPGPPIPGEVPGSEIFRINMRELKAGYPERNILLQAKDTVYVPKAAQVYVLGQVARPGAYRYEEGLTVFQALLAAGGVTERGSNKGVRIVRIVDGKSKEIKPRMDEAVLPEDTIRVPERFF
jgi:polysaccharide biosynthesis/export protein